MRLQGIRGGEVFCSSMIGSHTLSEPVRFWTMDAFCFPALSTVPLRWDTVDRVG